MIEASTLQSFVSVIKEVTALPSRVLLSNMASFTLASLDRGTALETSLLGTERSWWSVGLVRFVLCIQETTLTGS